MEKINDGFCSYYYFDREKNMIYNSRTNKYLKFDNNTRSIKLKTIDNKYKRINLKLIYQLLYNENYCIDNVKNLEHEEWREIEGTKKAYYVSNKGRVKSILGYEAIILKPLNLNGYLRVDLMIEGHKQSKLISRLVAYAFLDRPTPMQTNLHHKDRNKKNNSVENLLWCTPQEHKKIHMQLEQEDMRREKNEE